jgi:outer membrane lipoprotein LolB
VKLSAALRALALAAVLLTSACAELQLQVPPDEAQFELLGRIAVRYGDDASAGRIAWRHAASGDEVLITSPLGQAVARIVRSGDRVTLETADGSVHQAADAEALTEQVLGFRLPLEGLADWVRGREGNTQAVAQRDAAGRLARLQQSGWTIAYEAWSADGRLPTRLRLSYPGIEMRLAIAEWK